MRGKSLSPQLMILDRSSPQLIYRAWYQLPIVVMDTILIEVEWWQGKWGGLMFSWNKIELCNFANNLLTLLCLVALSHISHGQCIDGASAMGITAMERTQYHHWIMVLRRGWFCYKRAPGRIDSALHVAAAPDHTTHWWDTLDDVEGLSISWRDRSRNCEVILALRWSGMPWCCLKLSVRSKTFFAF